MATVSLNMDQKLYVISHGKGYSCLGFDVVEHYITEIARRVKKWGKSLDLVQAAKGSLERYSQYEEALRTYQGFNDSETWFDADTEPEVKDVINRLMNTDQKVRVFYGDKKTGRDWMDEYDVIGVLRRSSGSMKVPLLVAPRALGGGALLTGAIVRIVDTATKRELYRHKNYRLPSIVIEAIGPDEEYVESDRASRRLVDSGYTHSAKILQPNGTWTTQANFKSKLKAQHWKEFMLGNRMCK